MAGLGREPRRIARADRGAYAGCCERALEVDAGRDGVGVGASYDGGVQHSGQPDVSGVARLAAGPLAPVHARRRAPNRDERSRRPLVERVLLDEDPRLLDAALDFPLGLE
jgi:hypothetical protein